MITSAPIFLKLNYFRQKYLDVCSSAVSLSIYIWVQDEKKACCSSKITKESVAIQADRWKDVNKNEGPN